jgi:hypothetical protein
LSFLETGKAQPSREMVLHLCERLDVPLRERNMLLMAQAMRRYSLSAGSTILPSSPRLRRSSKYSAVMNLIPRLPSIVPGQ